MRLRVGDEGRSDPLQCHWDRVVVPCWHCGFCDIGCEPAPEEIRIAVPQAKGWAAGLHGDPPIAGAAKGQGEAPVGEPHLALLPQDGKGPELTVDGGETAEHVRGARRCSGWRVQIIGG